MKPVEAKAVHVTAMLRIRCATNYRHRDEWDMEQFTIDPETLESFVEDIIELGWIPKGYDTSPVGRKARFEDDEGYHLFMVVKDV